MEPSFDVPGLVGAGDINGDGLDDLTFQRYGAIYNAEGETVSYGGSGVIFGKADNTAVDAAEIILGSSDSGFAVSNVDTGGYQLGLVGAGDINGDGLGDLIFQRHGAIYSAEGEIVSYGGSGVIFGKADSAAVDAAEILLGSSDAGFAVSNVGSYYSNGLVAAGDINGDGLGDLIFQRYGEIYNAEGEFVSYGGSGVIFGKADSAAVDAAEIIQGSSAAGFAVSNVNTGGFVPGLVGAGDINGDGLDDLTFQRYGEVYNAEGEFVSYGGSGVIFGKADSAAVDAIGIILGSSDAGFAVSNVDTGGYQPGLVGAGDINGDGLDDLIFQRYGEVYNAEGEFVSYGSSGVIFGKADSLPVDILSFADGAGGGFDVSSVYAETFTNSYAPGEFNGVLMQDLAAAEIMLVGVQGDGDLVV